MAFVCALMVPAWADKLLPQLLMEQFDTLTIPCRHIEHMHEGVWLKKISAGLNFHLPKHKFFSLFLTVRGYLISIAY